MWVAVVCAATVGAATLAAAAPITDVGGTYGKITGGGLLVYGFGELPATAKHVGIARYD